MVDYRELMFKFFMSAVLGGLIGSEREYRSKSAGFRTMIMISIGACLFTILSTMFGPASSDRIASNIVTGIGFLGAGVIFKSEGRVNGITTAATIWVVSALGMGIGVGMYLASSMACCFILIVLVLLPFLESRIDDLNQIKTYTIMCNTTDTILAHLRSTCKENHLRHKIISIEKQMNEVSILLWTKGSEKNITSFTKSLWNDDLINGFKVQGLTELFPPHLAEKFNK